MARTRLHHALVVVDGTAETVHAAQAAIDLLDAPATLCLAFAPSHDAAADQDGEGVDATPLVAQCLDRRLRSRAASRRIALHKLSLTSDRVSELIARVEELQIDLLVLPLRGRVPRSEGNEGNDWREGDGAHGCGWHTRQLLLHRDVGGPRGRRLE